MLALVLLPLGLSAQAFAETSDPPLGLSAQVRPLSQVQRIVVQAVDKSALLAEDAQWEQLGLPPRYAVPMASDYTPQNAGTWEPLNSGERLWRLRVFSEGATSLNLGFGRYLMPAGGRLFVYSPDGSSVRGPFTDEDNEAHGELWTPVVPGDEAVIELSVPARMIPFMEIRLTSINRGYKGFFVPKADKSGSCNVDVVCPQGDDWRDEIRSVGVISTGGSTFCSGFLVNNTAEDLTPYFMTANHCGINAGNAPSLVVYGNYETSTCGGWPDGSLSQIQTGSIFRAARSASDFTVVELDDAPNPAHDVHWTGWDNSDADPVSATALHHPSTDEKRISFEYDPLETTTYLGTSVPGNGTHLRVVDWDLGTTEPGSSGSGLWNQDHRLVGQLHGGQAACGNDESDWYGRFSVSWDAGGSPSTQLKDWLDPGNTGAVTLDGIDQCPQPDVAFTADPNPGVAGDPVEFTSTVSGGLPPYSYEWDVDDDGLVDYTTPDVTHVYPGSFNGIVKLTVTDSFPCTAALIHQLAVCPAGEDCSCTDNDGDGYGDPDTGYCLFSGLDCSDTNYNMNPGRGEDCGNGIDDDCDGNTDNADSECGYSGTANAEASVHGPNSLKGSGLLNELALLFVPVVAIGLMILLRRKSRIS
jgi:hypothetical protein